MATTLVPAGTPSTTRTPRLAPRRQSARRLDRHSQNPPAADTIAAGFHFGDPIFKKRHGPGAGDPDIRRGDISLSRIRIHIF